MRSVLSAENVIPLFIHPSQEIRITVFVNNMKLIQKTA